MHLAPNISCLKTKSILFQMECYWRVVQKSVDTKEILKVNASGRGNEKLKDIFNAKKAFSPPVVKTLTISLKCLCAFEV